MKTVILAVLTVLSLGVGVGNATPPAMHHSTIQ
jgi:hypothetical protein